MPHHLFLLKYFYISYKNVKGKEVVTSLPE